MACITNKIIEDKSHFMMNVSARYTVMMSIFVSGIEVSFVLFLGKK